MAGPEGAQLCAGALKGGSSEAFVDIYSSIPRPCTAIAWKVMNHRQAKEILEIGRRTDGTKGENEGAGECKGGFSPRFRSPGSAQPGWIDRWYRENSEFERSSMGSPIHVASSIFSWSSVFPVSRFDRSLTSPFDYRHVLTRPTNTLV